MTPDSRSSAAEVSGPRPCCASTCCTAWSSRWWPDSSCPFTSGACGKTEASAVRYDLPQRLRQRPVGGIDLVPAVVVGLCLHRLFLSARREAEVEGGLGL